MNNNDNATWCLNKVLCSTNSKLNTVSDVISRAYYSKADRQGNVCTWFYVDLSPNVLTQWLVTVLRIRGGRGSNIWSKTGVIAGFFVVSSVTSMKITIQWLKIYQNRFLPHRFQFITFHRWIWRQNVHSKRRFSTYLYTRNNNPQNKYKLIIIYNLCQSLCIISTIKISSTINLSDTPSNFRAAATFLPDNSFKKLIPKCACLSSTFGQNFAYLTSLVH